ncbi:hypothetical protein LZ554_001460 [Drepanopeziza brunnea f. sp. 'monogermtubi']|nr:hypothetical protein LZ554_001460 [Drepanopeziza brunnea f. sp. 'monogermtubi']
MQFTKISLIAAAVLSGFAFAGKTDLDDIPRECKVPCANIEKIAQRCRIRRFGDASELQCICTAEGAQQYATTCETCVAQYDKKDEEHDLTKVVKACAWKPQVTPTPTSSSVPAFTNWPKATGLGPLPGGRRRSN